MVGEKFEIYTSQMSRIALNFPPWSAMVGKKFENYPSQMSRIALNCSPWSEKNLKFTPLKGKKLFHHGCKIF